MRLADRVRWGVGYGAMFGTGYVVVAVAIYLLQGPEAFAEVGVSLQVACLIYFGMGVLAGGLVGLLRPLAATRDGLLLVAVLTMFAICTAFGLAMFGAPWTWRRGEAFSVIITAIGLGVLIGMQFSPEGEK